MIFNKCLVIGEDYIITNFFNLFQNFGQLLYSSKPAGLKCVASYPYKATSVFLPPLFVIHPKFEFSLEFTHRRLVEKQSFVPTILVGHRLYPTDATHRYSVY